MADSREQFLLPEERRIIDEQDVPKPSEGDVWLLVLKDMEERRQHGIEKYGTPLQTHNGRDPLIDAYQEALDLCVYLRQAIEERNSTAKGDSLLLDDCARYRNALIRIRKALENGREWEKMSAGSLHLIITEALDGNAIER